MEWLQNEFLMNQSSPEENGWCLRLMRFVSLMSEVFDFDKNASD